MNAIRLLIALSCFALLGCSWFVDDVGYEGQPCTRAGVCVDGSVCLHARCVDLNSLDGDSDTEDDADDSDKDTSEGDAVDGDALDGDTEDGDDSDSDSADTDAVDGDSETESEVADGETSDPNTWIDPNTGLEWQVLPTGGAIVGVAASEHCEELGLSGKKWRLPNISELRSLIRNCAPVETGGVCAVKDNCLPCGVASGDTCVQQSCWTAETCDPTSCPNVSGLANCYWLQGLGGECSWYWSSSAVPDNPGYYWFVNYAFAKVDSCLSSYNVYIRCVRDTESVDGDSDKDLDEDSDGDVTESETNEFDPDSETLTTGFARITAASFTMGSPESEPGRGVNETLHDVTLTYNFEMKTTEVTQAEWTSAFSGTNPSWFGPNADGADCGTNCPVERVNWFEALEYANKLSLQKGLTPCYVLSGCTGTIGAGCLANEPNCTSGTYSCATVTLAGSVSKPQECVGFRLPTEAEWEFSARAGSSSAFYTSSGNDGSITQTDSCSLLDVNLDKIAWYCANFNSKTHLVGGKAPNAWGLLDMSGNVFEWVWDSWDGSSDYGTTNMVDPIGVTEPNRVARGGAWYYFGAKDCRSALRSYAGPGYRSSVTGFRIARSLP